MADKSGDVWWRAWERIFENNGKTHRQMTLVVCSTSRARAATGPKVGARARCAVRTSATTPQ